MTITKPTAEPAPDAERARVEEIVGDPDVFLAEHWDRYPLHHRGGADLGRLFSFEAMREVVGWGAIVPAVVNVYHEGEWLKYDRYVNPPPTPGDVFDEIPDAVSPRRIFELLDAGATIALNGTTHYWPPMRELCEPLRDFLGRYVEANVYALPANARGVKPHHDTHDVIFVQIEGRKHWRLWKPNISRPLPQELGFTGYRDEDMIMDIVLEAGDSLYIPRGFPHASRTSEAASLHVTLAIRPLAWIDLIKAVVDEAVTDERFREALPLGAGADPASSAARLEELAAAVHERIAAADYAAAAELVRDGRSR